MQPAQVFDRITEWMHVPVPWQEALSQLNPELARLIEMSAAVDLAASIDPDAFSSPKALFAVSLGLKDFEQALHAVRNTGGQLERVSRNVYFVQLGENGNCMISRANGAAKARLVCADDRKSLDVLAPFMARTMPTQDLGQRDLHIELIAEPVRRRFGKKAHMLKVGVPVFLREFSIGNARFDGALADAAHAVVDETLLLIEELDRIDIDANMNPQRQALELDFSLRLRGHRSFTGKRLVAAAKGVAPAPEMFWKLPADVGAASYAAATTDTAAFEPILINLTDMLAGGAEHLGLPSETLKAWIQSYQQLWRVQGPGVAAFGGVPFTTKTQSKAEKEAAALKATLGYRIYGVDGDEGRLVTWVDQTIKLWNDAKLRDALSKQGRKELKSLPMAKRGPVPAGMPKGTVAYSLAFTPQAFRTLFKDNRFDGIPPLTFHALVAQDGARTWIGVSMDDKALVKRMLAILKPTGATLEARSGLEPLRQPASSAGFFTLRTMLDAARSGMDDAAKADFDIEKAVLDMPNKGDSPIFASTTASQEGPTFRMTAHIPKAALEDATSVVMSARSQQAQAR
jgi:hypothetical protein